MRISLTKDSTLRARFWGNETVVFDEVNGRTQLLAYPADLLLVELQKNSRSIDDLTRLIESELQVTHSEAAEYVRGAVQSLSEQGLVMVTHEE